MLLCQNLAPLVEVICHCRDHTDRTIVFCRTYDDCGMIYLYLKTRLGDEMREPVGASDRSPFWLVEMFTACTHPEVKSDILRSSFAYLTANSGLSLLLLHLGWE